MCTGTEANDLAVQIARVVTGNEGVIVTERSYHGNSELVGKLSTDSYPESERPDWLAVVEPPNTYRGPFREPEPDLGAQYAALVDDGTRRSSSSAATASRRSSSTPAGTRTACSSRPATTSPAPASTSAAAAVS